jgi:hypothetical protein
MAREIVSEILVETPAGRVWEIITDLGRYEQWNPFIPRARGRIEPGARVEIEVHPPGRKRARFRPRVVQVIPGSSFQWIGRVLVPGLYDGRHFFELHPVSPSSVRFVQRERVSGLIVLLMWSRLSGPVREGYRQMNEALKRRAEG